jgi:hypothetical protein
VGAFERSPYRPLTAGQPVARSNPQLYGTLHTKPYRLPFLEAISVNDKEVPFTFCVDLLLMMKNDETLVFESVFDEEASFVSDQ